MKCSCLSVLLVYATQRTDVQLELPPSVECFKFLSRKLTCVTGEESDRTGADIADANWELQRYTAELQDRAPLQAQSAIQLWLDRESSYKRLSQLTLDLVASPASQAYVERLFSLCSDLTARKRNRTRTYRCRRVFLKLNRHILH